jgi:hypothetical protein
MNYVIERLWLTDDDGRAAWSNPPAPEKLGEEAGFDAGAVLALIVAREGGTQVGVSASFSDGQAVVVAQKGESLFALRAVPGRLARCARD